MATLMPRRGGWPSSVAAGRGFSKETASPLWAITAWIVGLIVFFLCSTCSLPASKQRTPRSICLRSSSSGRRSRTTKPSLVNFLPFFRNSIVTSLVSTFFVMLLAIPLRVCPGSLSTEKVEEHLLLHLHPILAGGGCHRSPLRHLQPHRRSSARRQRPQLAWNAAWIDSSLHG